MAGSTVALDNRLYKIWFTRHFRNVDLTNPDLVALARSFGAFGLRVTPSDPLPRLLALAVAATGVTLIDCPISYDRTDVLESDSLLDSARQELSADDEG